MFTDFTCICYNFLFIVTAMSSANSKSAPSSKRRKVQNLCSEIFDNVNITDRTTKEKYCYSVRFCIYSSRISKGIRQSLQHILHWHWNGRIGDEIRQTISSLQTGILSQSNMKWENVPRILVGSIHKFKDIDDLTQYDDTKKEDLKSQYHTTDKIGIVRRQCISRSFYSSAFPLSELQKGICCQVSAKCKRSPIIYRLSYQNY